jgi:hypothetical protein
MKAWPGHHMVYLRGKDFIPTKVNTSLSIGLQPPGDHVDLCSESFLLSPFVLPSVYKKPSKILVRPVDYPLGKGNIVDSENRIDQKSVRYQKDSI